MPARVIDLRMRIHLENFPIDRALLKKPDNGDFTLIVLFDFAKTWFVCLKIKFIFKY